MRWLLTLLFISTLKSYLVQNVCSEESNKMEGKIKGGRFASILNHPNVAALSIECAIEGRPFDLVYLTCGASIINQQFLLTAAHCLTKCNTSSYIGIAVGTEKVYEVTHLANDFITHCDHDDITQENDIALIRTDHIKFGAKVKRAIFMQNLTLPNSKKGWIAAWGWIDEKLNHSRLELIEAELFILPEQDCRTKYPKRPPHTFCAAGINQKDYEDHFGFPAVGDGGSGLTLNKTVVVGILSHKRKSDRGTNISTSVFTEVRPFYNWIITHMRLLCDKDKPHYRPNRPNGPLKVEDARKEKATVNWKKPDDWQFSDITNYTLEKMDKRTGKWVPCGDTGPEIREFTVRGLTPLHQYKFRVRAINDRGRSKPLETAGFVVVKDKPNRPNGPIQAVDTREEKATIIWKKPDDWEVSDITGYTLESMDKNTGKWVPCGGDTGPEPTKFTVKNLTPFHRYKFRVSAVNDEGKSKPLETADFFLVRGKPNQPNGPIEVVNTREQKATVRWKKPNDWQISDITGYTLDKMDMNTGKWVSCGDTGQKSTEFTVTGLTPLHKYKFRVHAVNQEGKSKPLESDDFFLVRGKPNRPNGPIEVVDTREDKATVYWRKPDDWQISDITGYTVEMMDVYSSTWVPCGETGPESTKFTVYGLTRHHRYKFRVHAVNQEGKSKPLESDDFFLVRGKPNRPNGPIEVVDTREEKATVNWKKPDDWQISDITGYTVEMMDVNTGKWVPCGETGPESTKFTVYGLTPHHRYKFRVSAVNKEGKSNPLETVGSIVARNRAMLQAVCACSMNGPARPGKYHTLTEDRRPVRVVAIRYY